MFYSELRYFAENFRHVRYFLRKWLCRMCSVVLAHHPSPSTLDPPPWQAVCSFVQLCSSSSTQSVLHPYVSFVCSFIQQQENPQSVPMVLWNEIQIPSFLHVQEEAFFSGQLCSPWAGSTSRKPCLSWDCQPGVLLQDWAPSCRGVLGALAGCWQVLSSCCPPQPCPWMEGVTRSSCQLGVPVGNPLSTGAALAGPGVLPGWREAAFFSNTVVSPCS